MTFTDAKQRFSDRVTDYVRYRPGYPAALVDLLRGECGLRADHVVADIGSGTGILARLFLEHGNQVFGVEPNQEMRRAGEEYLCAFTKFSSVNGSAENTTLSDACVDFVVAGQAFHWFEPAAARVEFARILRPAGLAVVIWNERLLHTTAFLRGYEALLQRFGKDYAQVSESYPRLAQIQAFFPQAIAHKSFRNFQEFDCEGLAGRVRSSSYMPQKADTNFAAMMSALRELFAATEQSGRVRMDYTTQVYLGSLDAKRNLP
jgi:ubiquinone/menaquinone biosynthesis C-methylase UbiE